jgi:hypothetical protein
MMMMMMMEILNRIPYSRILDQLMVVRNGSDILLHLALQSFMDLGLLDDPPSDIPIQCFLPPCFYFQ